MHKSSKNQRKRKSLAGRFFTGVFRLILTVLLVSFLTVAGINIYMAATTSGQILTEEEAQDLEDVDYILILGAAVHGTTPSLMLRDRLNTGIALYQTNVSGLLLMSGDHSTQYYDEVGAMQLYAVEAGVPQEDILLDPLGLCTYDSIARAISEYQANKIVIVTQRYHMYRALYIANQLGLEAYGVNSDPQTYSGQIVREIREVAARCKDFLIVHLADSSSTFLGDLTTRISGLSVKY